jgi:hypothetical protein
MNKLFLTILGGLAAGLTAHAATVKLWDFNSVEFNSPGVGTLRPTDAIGFPAEASGGVANQFGQVSVVSGSSDPNTLDNSHWRLGSVANVGSFPVATNANKTAGGSFRVNTSGYNNLQLTWDQENSATASRYWRLQYTTNGTLWLDTTNVITANSIGTPNPETDTPTWQLGLTADLSALAGVNDNPDFGVRLVAEFEATATGAGTNAYVANRASTTYSVNGTFWLDMVTVTGEDLNPGNQWPVVSAINDQSTLANQATAALDFTVYDVETPVDNLVITAHSSNPTLVNNFNFGGSAGERTITATPATGQTGTAVITVRVKDGGNKITESSFRLTVFAAPLTTRIFPQITSAAVPVTNSFTVINLPGDPADWVLTGSSSHPGLVANADIVFSGTDTNRTVKVTPQPNVLGDATITITATSGAFQATTNFLVRIAPNYLVEWDFDTATNTAVATTVAAGIAASDLSRGAGIRTVNLGRGFGADRWNSPASAFSPSTANRANAIARGDYFQFSVTVAAGKSLSLATLDASLRRSALNAALNFEWQYSLNNFATAGVTILPRGPIWSVLGLTNASTFQYQGRLSGSPPATLEPYDWVLKDVPGRADLVTTPGDAIPTIDLSNVASLQNINGPTTVTFRLYGWGNANTADSNTSSLGRVNGPRVRGTVATSLILQQPSVGPGAVQLNLTGEPATSYLILRAAEITGPWTTNGTVLTDGSGAGLHTDNAPLSGGAFYRAYHP